MTSEGKIILETEQPQLTENTPTSRELLQAEIDRIKERALKAKQAVRVKEAERCTKCGEGPQNIEKLCFSCAFLPRVDTLSWETCTECKKEWSKLKDNGLCWDCDKKKFDTLLQRKQTEERFKKIFGSHKSMNYYTFGHFNVTEGTEEAFEACQKFDAAKQNLYLWGTVGTGKTHLAYAAAKNYALHGYRVIVSTPLKMVDIFRTKGDLEKEGHFQDFAECDVLLIDDLGISKYTDFGLEVLCEILNRRTLQMRNGLIITSNLDLERLAKRNGDDRLSSRIAGLCQVIMMMGKDFRVIR